MIDIRADAERYTKTSNEVVYLIKDENRPIIYSRYYAKYLQVNDFIFGR